MLRKSLLIGIFVLFGALYLYAPDVSNAQSPTQTIPGFPFQNTHTIFLPIVR